jgi:hypothetical protein
MKIIGFNLTKISIQRKEKFDSKLEIKQNINIDDITKDKINISKDEILKINFTFAVNYNPDFAKLEFKGGLVIIPEKDEMKKIMKEWKNKQLAEEFRAPLFNFIMNKCNIKALSLEDEMALPLHVPMPRINPNQLVPKTK